MRRKLWKTTGFALLTLAVSVPAVAIWPFPPKRFSGNSLLAAGPMGVNTDGRVVAFGDFNGDQFLDLLTLNKDQQTFTTYTWSHEEYTFNNIATFKHPRRVLNVVPGDFTQDGTLDFLVMSQGSSSNQLDISLYIGSPQGGFNMNFISAPSSALAQPIPMDMNGDLRIDLLGVEPSAPSTFKVWQNVWNSSDPSPSKIYELVDPMMTGSQCTISNPHSNAAVDLNGDCLADIFLVCDEGNSGDKYFQIWINNKESGFSLAQLGRFPRGVQSITFSDIDRDGTMDMLFTTCDSVSSSTGLGSNCKLNIAFNQQLPLCTSSSGSVKNGKLVCRPPTALCTADPDFKFDLNDSADNPNFLQVPISDIFPSHSSRPLSLLVLDTTFSPPLPVPIKLGDANQDGFPDILAILATGSGSRRERTPYLAYSVPCAKGVPGCDAKGKGKRGWNVLQKGGDILASVKDARGVAFMDMDEDGTLDIMVQRTGEQGQGTVTFIQNNFYYDAFFLKAIVINGACGSGLCSTANGTKYHPFGVSYSGATYKYTVLDTSGRRSAAEVGQLPQTAYQSLITPYSYFGLGRTNNYIENLFVGSTKHTKEHFINMEGVIPNSKVVIIPPLGTSNNAWKRELYLRPGEWIVWVTLTVVASMIVLGIIVFVLHLNEKREDELERRKSSHHINFDAL